MESKIRVRIPQITSVETALQLYYKRIELSGADIKELFGEISNCTIAKLKNKARELMRERNTPMWNSQNVNTEVAYEAWGLNIESLERKFAKLQKLEGRSEKNLTKN